MKITKTSDGQLEFALNFDELETIGQCLNEVCHGFTVNDFKPRIGVEKDVVVTLLDQIVATYPSTMKA